MRTQVRSLLVAAIVLATGSFCFAEQIDNPAYKSWAKFKPGTSVTLKSETDMGGNKTNTEITTTLVEMTADKAVVEMKMSMVIGGKPMDMPAQKHDVPAKIEKPAATDATTPKPEVKESTDTVAVSGKDYKCKVTETTMTNSGVTSNTKAWISEEIPGSLVKSETTIPDGAMKGTTKMSVSSVTIK